MIFVARTYESAPSDSIRVVAVKMLLDTITLLYAAAVDFNYTSYSNDVMRPSWLLWQLLLSLQVHNVDVDGVTSIYCKALANTINKIKQ